MKQWRQHLSMLGRMPSRGEEILVWIPHAGALVRAKVQAVRHGEVMYKMLKDVLWREGARRDRLGVSYRLDYTYAGTYRHGRVRRRLEHKEWVRANDTADTHAFMAEIALDNT